MTAELAEGAEKIMGTSPTPGNMTTSELLEALHARGLPGYQFYQVEYLLRTFQIPSAKKDRKNRRIFTNEHLEAVLAAEAKKAQGQH